MGFKITRDYKGLTKLKKDVESLEDTLLEAGFFEEDRYGPENDNLYVATVAFWNERGIGVPRRSFLEPAFLDPGNLGWYRSMTLKVMQEALNGNNFTPQLKALGEQLKGDIQVNIEDYPGSNSRQWVEIKGFDDPLFYTGKMLDSVKYKIRRK